MTINVRRRPVPQSAVDRVFKLQLSNVVATVRFMPNESQELLEELGIKPGRGGKADFKWTTFSWPGEGHDDERLVGVWHRDKETGEEKEDPYLVEKSGYITPYPKGKYEIVNPLYRGTHHPHWDHPIRIDPLE